LAGALVMSAARPARADDTEDFLIALAIGIVAVDVVITGVDIGMAAKEEVPSPGWLYAETAITAPQALVLNGALPFIISEERDPAGAAMLVPTIMVSTMTAHGVSGLVLVDVEPAEHIGVSAAIATNIALTNAVLTYTFMGELSATSVAAMEVSATVPQIIVGSVKAASSESNRAGWIGLTGWAGGLFLHGLVSLIASDGGDSQMRLPDVRVASPSPPPLSGALRSRRASLDPGAGLPSRADRVVASPRIRLAPTMVSDGVNQAPGLGMTGLF
jgi:hypothetical protein